MREDDSTPAGPVPPNASPPALGREDAPPVNGLPAPPPESTPAPVPTLEAVAPAAPTHESVPRPTERIAAGPPPGAPEGGIREGVPPGAPATPTAHPTEAMLLLRQLTGLLIILCSGWGFIVFVGFMSKTWNVGLSLSAAAGFASVLSFCFFLALERNLWLSRFIGLRLSPHASPVVEALFFWFFGFVALLLRPTVSPEAAPAHAPSATDKLQTAQPEMKDGFREIVETVVFVVVLVLLLKGFLAEAFVIPTGSMATTLLGYHRDVECPQCGYHFRINMSSQLDAEQPQRAIVTGCTCPNCFLPFNLPISREGPQP